MFNKDQNVWEKFFDSISFRLLVIGFLILILLIPLASIRQLIWERQNRSKAVAEEISSKWGEKQIVTGPVLSIPYDLIIEKYNKDSKTYIMQTKTNYLHILPERLNFDCSLAPETRYRGIFKVVVYKARLSADGNFILPDLSELGIKSKEIHWQEAQLSFSLSDFRSLQENIDFTCAGQQCNFESGSRLGLKNAVHSTFQVDPANTEIPFNFTLNFNGSSQLMFMPLGKTTTVNMSSIWQDPSFTGSFLPDNRDISEAGFTASWQVLHLNRPIQQLFLPERTIPLESTSAFGVDLFLPVDHYVKSERSVKYAVLLIFLTFISFLATSIFLKIKIHPLQYLLIGFALCIFYSLLISIAEHTGFDIAYWLAALATTILLILYSGAVLASRKFSFVLGFIILLLYTFIFVIIQLQDYALLTGSIGLFTVIALLMYLSVKLKILK